MRFAIAQIEHDVNQVRVCWQISPAMIQRDIPSMRQRFQVVINTNGGQTLCKSYICEPGNWGYRYGTSDRMTMARFFETIVCKATFTVMYENMETKGILNYLTLPLLLIYHSVLLKF